MSYNKLLCVGSMRLFFKYMRYTTSFLVVVVLVSPFLPSAGTNGAIPFQIVQAGCFVSNYNLYLITAIVILLLSVAVINYVKNKLSFLDSLKSMLLNDISEKSPTILVLVFNIFTTLIILYFFGRLSNLLGYCVGHT